MVGGRLLRLPYFFTCSAALLLVVCQHDVEASCGDVVHKKVGDTVELPPCSPNEGLTVAVWKYEESKIVEWDLGDVYSDYDVRFEGRASINTTTFNLRLERLTLNDSGIFTFVSEMNGKQRNTTRITLQVDVHPGKTLPEAITKDLVVVVVKSTWHAANSSCTVLLECNAPHHTGASYRWAVGGQDYQGPRVSVSLQPQEGNNTVTCTVSNSTSEKSAAEVVTCVAETSHFVILAVAAGIGCLVVVTLCVTVAVCYYKQRQAGTVLADSTIYTSISNNPTMIDERSSNSTNATAIYDTIDDSANSVVTSGVRAKPQTVYDEIHLNRMTDVC